MKITETSMNEKARSLRIVFMGTPEFAVASLDALVRAGCHIVGVVTAPDKPAGRGMQLQQSAVKQYAVAQGLHVLQPEKLKNPTFLDELKSLQADLQIVVAFRMLPELVWNMPPMGTVNVHGSLLPQYRGAAPINWAIINGETQTGVTTFKLQHEIDTGDILDSAVIPIPDAMNAGELHDEMKEIGAQLLLKTVQSLADGTSREIPQPTTNEPLKHAPKIFTETTVIDWHRPVHQTYNLIRGLSPFPGAYSFLEGKKMKIFQSSIIHQQPITAPGTVFSDGKTYLYFTTPDGYLSVQELQLEGKKKMPVIEFLKGYRWQNTPHKWDANL